MHLELLFFCKLLKLLLYEKSTQAEAVFFVSDSELMEWTRVELTGSPPANRLDFACCTVRLRVSDKNNATMLSGATSSCEQDLAKLKIVSDAQPREVHQGANIIELNLESNADASSGNLVLLLV
jgi:hypothetical protein